MIINFDYFLCKSMPMWKRSNYSLRYYHSVILYTKLWGKCVWKQLNKIRHSGLYISIHTHIHIHTPCYVSLSHTPHTPHIYPTPTPIHTHSPPTRVQPPRVVNKPQITPENGRNEVPVNETAVGSAVLLVYRLLWCSWRKHLWIPNSSFFTIICPYQPLYFIKLTL